MAAPTGITIDQWSPLSHIEAIGQPGVHLRLDVAHTWVPDSERRRIAAYLVLAAYRNNVAREFLRNGTTEEQRRAYREYGDPSVIIDRIVAAVLGDGWTIAVGGAADDLNAGPPLPEAPEPPGDSAPPVEQRIHTARTAAYERDVEEIVTAWEQALDAQPVARQRQAELDTWADRRQLRSHIAENEGDAAGLGDGVMVLWPAGQGEWPNIEVYEPGFYFPQLPDDGAQGQYPETVHLAWEYESTTLGVTETYVRRMSFELVDLSGRYTTVDQRSGDLMWLGVDGLPADRPVLQVGDTVLEGRIVRTLPWLDEDGEPATTDRTCVYSDGTWRLADVQSGKVDALDDSKALGGITRRDLGIDFIPVLHTPGTAGKGHYGDSVLASVAQVIDDLCRNDSDIMGASEYLGAPVVALSGKREFPDGGQVLPGRGYSLGENGRMDTLDLSASITELFGLGERIIDRLLRNVGIPSEAMGRVQAGQVAGITLLLRYAPFAQLVGGIRQIREPKYRLLLKMAQRMAMVDGAIEPGPIIEARIAWGNFLPTDRAETVKLVTEALNAHAMSTQTAVRMLIAAGVPVDDAAAEIERIRNEDTGAALNVANATGSELAAAKFLGIEVPEAAPPPAINLPPLT